MMHAPLGKEIVLRAPGWQRIDALGGNIERVFLRSGDNLVLLSEGLMKLSAPIDALIAVQDHTWAVTEDKLLSLQDVLNQLEEALFQQSTAAATIFAATQELAKDVKAISRTIRIMKIVALNARVAASALISREEGLNVFTTTVGELVNSTDETLQAVLETISKIHDVTAKSFEDGLSNSWDTLEDVRHVIGALMERVRDIRSGGNNGGNFGQVLQQRLVALRDEFTQTALAMQAGDRARQRLEHSVAIIGLAEQAGSLFVTGLAQAQLHGTTDTLVQDINMIDQRMQDLLGSARRLAGQNDQATAEDTAKGLGQSVHAVCSKVKSLDKARSELDKLSAAATTDFAFLSEALNRVGNLEGQMKMVGVNAIISCGRLGDEGLALKEVANQLAELASGIAVHLKNVKSCLTAMDSQSEQLNHEHVNAPLRLIEEMTGASRAIVDELETTLAEWRQVRHGMTDVQRQISKRLPEDLKAMKALASGLKTTALEIGRPPVPEHTPPMDLVQGTVYSLYSTDEERSLHKSYCLQHGHAPDVSAPEALPPAATQEEDDIFF